MTVAAEPLATQGKMSATTKVSVESSLIEIEKTLRRYKANGFASGWDERRRLRWLMFESINGLPFRFSVRRLAESEITQKHVNTMVAAKLSRQPKDIVEAVERQQWRVLVRLIQVSLETVEDELFTMEEALIAHAVQPNGQTFSEQYGAELPRLAATGALPKMLTAPRFIEGEVIDG